MATPIAFPICWSLSSLAETVTSDHASAACYRGIKNIRVHTVVVAELKFRDVKRQILFADLVERANHAAFKDRPETFNRVCVHRADNVLAHLMMHFLARVLPQAVVNAMSVGREQRYLVGHDFAHEALRRFGRDAFQNASDDVALSLYRADDRSFASAGTARALMALVRMAVVILAANPRLINFHDAAEFDFGLDQRRTDFVAHGMRRLVAAKAHHALDLERAHSLLAGEHQMGDAIPVPERLLGVLENRPAEAREPIALRGTFTALPVKRLVARGVVQVRIAAARAMNALGPAARDQIAKTRLIVTDRKAVLKLPGGHLRDWLRTFCHDGYPLNPMMEPYCTTGRSLSSGR